MAIDDTTGLIEWIPGLDQEGLSDVEITATNAARGVDTQNFQVDVAPYSGPTVTNVTLGSTSGGGYTTDDLTLTYDLGGTAATAATAARRPSAACPWRSPRRISWPARWTRPCSAHP